MPVPHRLSHADSIVHGAAESADRTQRGVPLSNSQASNLVVIDLGMPAVEDPNGLVESVSQGAGTLAMDGAIADANLDADGNVVLDVPRCLVYDSGGADTSVIIVTGYDQYGKLMIESKTLNGTSVVAGTKAFKKIRSITNSSTISNGAFIGTGKRLGLPYAPVPGGFVRGRAGEDTSDSGTYVAPVRTDPATATTGDVRGTYEPAATLDAATRITVVVAMKNGPQQADAFGVEQYDG